MGCTNLLDSGLVVEELTSIAESATIEMKDEGGPASMPADKTEKSYRVSTSRLFRTSFALDGRYADMTEKLRKQRGISQTEYVKGLIALDWLNTMRQPLDITHVPAWIVVAYKLDVKQGKVQPHGKLETIEQ